MDNGVAIDLSHITVEFRTPHIETGKKGLKKRKNIIRHRVIDDLSLTVGCGETLGIIGRNGCGKSTLLSIMARIMDPDSGNVAINGKIASILELGMGFNPNLTGRENIYLKGELYGFDKKTINDKIDKIVKYSDLGEQIDHPVRTYSSGMSGKLAFAVMVNVDAEIMLIDEVLSVGDISFSSKAISHFTKLAHSGKTIVFVSHSLETVKSFCKRTIWIDGGHIVMDGPSDRVCSAYRNKMSEDPAIIQALAEDGVAESQYRLALLYRDGTVIDSNPDLFRQWLKSAADGGYPPAQVDYADLILAEGIENTGAAMAYYESAASIGNEDARSRIALLSVASKTRKYYFLDAIRPLIDETNPQSCYEYGMILLRLSTNYREKSEAFHWLKQAAELGHLDSLYQAALLYRDGVGTNRDVKQMEHYLLTASEKGHFQATLTLADIYFQGTLLPKDDSKAFEFFKLLAELGEPRSEFQLAKMYREGLGT